MMLHECVLNGPSRAYGAAAETCSDDEQGRFWISNGEYSSQVNFCPVCGAKAPQQIIKPAVLAGYAGLMLETLHQIADEARDRLRKGPDRGDERTLQLVERTMEVIREGSDHA